MKGVLMRSWTWRERAAQVIEQVLRETRGQSEEEIKRALFEAYPFHERRMYPYKVWLDEIKRQRGLKTRIGVKVPEVPEGQAALFEEEVGE